MANFLLLSVLLMCVILSSGEENYKFEAECFTWKEAQQNCQKWGGELVTITNSGQNVKIFNEIKRRGMKRAWIGYTDIKKEGTFVWVDESTCSKYTNWGDHEPNNLNTEHCTEILVGYKGKWNDRSCNVKMPSVCYKTTVASEYIFVKYEMTNMNAEANCQALGAELVTIQNAEQDAYIYKEMNRRGMKRAWIGYSDVKNEGKFVWADPYTCSKYKNWDVDEPNNKYGIEDCTEIRGDRKGKWNDLPCSLKRSSVCFKPAGVRSQFKFVVSKHSYKNAVKNCRKLGGELATIQNAAQNSFVAKELKRKGIHRAWIGLNDLKKENCYKWVDPNTCSHYTNWDEDEPNNFGNEDCVEILSDSDKFGKWNDYYCNHAFPSVCFKMTGFFRKKDAVEQSYLKADKDEDSKSKLEKAEDLLPEVKKDSKSKPETKISDEPKKEIKEDEISKAKIEKSDVKKDEKPNQAAMTEEEFIRMDEGNDEAELEPESDIEDIRPKRSGDYVKPILYYDLKSDDVLEDSRLKRRAFEDEIDDSKKKK